VDADGIAGAGCERDGDLPGEGAVDRGR
jgi:hypothetical protein